MDNLGRSLCLKTLNLLLSEKTVFPTKVRFTGSRGSVVVISLGTAIQHTTVSSSIKHEQ